MKTALSILSDILFFCAIGLFFLFTIFGTALGCVVVYAISIDPMVPFPVRIVMWGAVGMAICFVFSLLADWIGKKL